jgi:ketosteroid isomerase-like protein
MRSLPAIVVMILLALAADVSALALTGGARADKEIHALLNRYARAYERKDLETIMAMIASKPEPIFVYPGPEGLRVGRSQIKAAYERDFSKFQSAKIDYTSISVGSRGRIAWFASEWVATVDMDGQELTIPARWTAVLEKRHGKWLFVQSHFTYDPVAPKERG